MIGLKIVASTWNNLYISIQSSSCCTTKTVSHNKSSFYLTLGAVICDTDKANLVLERLSKRYFTNLLVSMSVVRRVTMWKLGKPQQTTFSLVSFAAPTRTPETLVLHADTCTQHRWSQISQFLPTALAFHTSIRRVPMAILPWCSVWKNQNGLATRWWKHFEDVITCFDKIYERDRQRDRRTDGRTPHDGIGRTCIALRENEKQVL